MEFTLFRTQDAPKLQKDLTGMIVSGTPEQQSQLNYSGHGGVIKAGVWDSTAGVFRATMTDLVEFCHILEGSATIRIGSGECFDVVAGDAFVMDAGLETEWTVATYVKKHFVICSTLGLPPA